MSLNRLSRFLVKTNIFVRDVNAAKRGKLGKRLQNRAIGRLNNKIMRGIWRR
jgi:hypothetical protein